MNLSRLFIVRPVATTLLMMALLLVGALGFRRLPVSALPQVDYPTMQVLTFYPGAGAYVMASSVTAPLERQFGQMPGLKQMTSTSSIGASRIILQFALEMGLDVAEQQVQAAINAAVTFLPVDLPVPPVYSKVNPADAPILTLALSSKTLPLREVSDLADTRLSQRLAQLPGVGLVTLSGGQRTAVRIRANPTALSARQLSLEDIRSAVRAANINQAKGGFDGPRVSYVINANDQLLHSQDYAPLVIAYRNGSAVHLSDVAEVVDDVENTYVAAFKNDEPAVILSVQRQPGANVIAVVDDIEQLLPKLQSSLPTGVELTVLSDRTTTIRASVREVELDLILGVVLVVVVTYFFLGSARATIIPSVAVPLSLIATFGVMSLLDFSLNNLTLMALTVATGFVIDDAIVMIENVSRYIEEGEAPLEAALHGSQEIAFTIVSLTVSLIAVLIPLLFMADVVGRLFREFAVTLGISILFSAVVSLTLTPMMCARLLQPVTRAPGPEPRRRWYQGWFQRAQGAYGRSLRRVLDHQTLTLAIALATLALSAVLYVVVPKGFFPTQDTGAISAVVEAPPAVSFDAMVEAQRAMARMVLEDPAVDGLSSFIGVDGINPTQNRGRMLINLKPERGKTMTASQVARRLTENARHRGGVAIFAQPVQDLTVDALVSPAPYQFSVSGPDAGELATWSPRVVRELSRLPEIEHLSSDQVNQGLTVHLEVDRVTAARLGISQALIDDTLYDAFGQRQISIIFTQANQYRVVLEVASGFRETPADLGQVYVPSVGGGPVPLDAIARRSEVNGALVVNRQGQFPATTISFDLAPKVSLGTAVRAVKAAVARLSPPSSLEANLQGTAAAFEASLSSEPWLILAAVVTVYIVLGVLYESYIHPLTILSTLPSAGVGAIAALMLAGLELDVVSLIGIVLLIGIVKKNAIMMVDFALEAERVRGMSPPEAIYQACLLRFRPIMMTTLAAMFGALPLALGRGVGAELRRPLGLAIVGGLLVSQVLTLYTTPVIYLWFGRWGLPRRGRHQSGIDGKGT